MTSRRFLQYSDVLKLCIWFSNSVSMTAVFSFYDSRCVIITFSIYWAEMETEIEKQHIIHIKLPCGLLAVSAVSSWWHLLLFTCALIRVFAKAMTGTCPSPSVTPSITADYTIQVLTKDIQLASQAHYPYLPFHILFLTGGIHAF